MVRLFVNSCIFTSLVQAARLSEQATPKCNSTGVQNLGILSKNLESCIYNGDFGCHKLNYFGGDSSWSETRDGEPNWNTDRATQDLCIKSLVDPQIKDMPAKCSDKGVFYQMGEIESDGVGASFEFAGLLGNFMDHPFCYWTGAKPGKECVTLHGGRQATPFGKIMDSANMLKGCTWEVTSKIWSFMSVQLSKMYAVEGSFGGYPISFHVTKKHLLDCDTVANDLFQSTMFRLELPEFNPLNEEYVFGGVLKVYDHLGTCSKTFPHIVNQMDWVSKVRKLNIEEYTVYKKRFADWSCHESNDYDCEEEEEELDVKSTDSDKCSQSDSLAHPCEMRIACMNCKGDKCEEWGALGASGGEDGCFPSWAQAQGDDDDEWDPDCIKVHGVKWDTWEEDLKKANSAPKSCPAKTSTSK